MIGLFLSRGIFFILGQARHQAAGNSGPFPSGVPTTIALMVTTADT